MGYELSGTSGCSITTGTEEWVTLDHPFASRDPPVKDTFKPIAYSP
jgi:hypothetical protein